MVMAGADGLRPLFNGSPPDRGCLLHPLQTPGRVFVLSLTRRCRGVTETIMSPFCLIDIAGIREHSSVPHDVPAPAPHWRFTSWVLSLFHHDRV
jgi:hypothetical protein